MEYEIINKECNICDIECEMINNKFIHRNLINVSVFKFSIYIHYFMLYIFFCNEYLM